MVKKKRSKTSSSKKAQDNKRNRKSKNFCDSILSQKKDELNWQKFNFLENLIIFCAMPERKVPKESGVYFSISSTPSDKSIMILFKIDRRQDPLVDGARPDYMTLYVKGDNCICTIIEMKGKDEKKFRRGIEQIRKLKERLQEEIREHLPINFKIKLQGILLTPPNAQIPLRILEKLNFITPLQYHHKFELYDYISKINDKKIGTDISHVEEIN